ncbi:MAG: ATP-binding protein [Planctomycetota bacterium]
MTIASSRILLALPGPDRDLFAGAVADLGGTPLIAEDRATCVRLAAEHKPAIAVLDISPANGNGGGALADVLRQTVPTICPLVIGPDGERPFVEGMLVGDLYLPRPISPELARYALRTLLTRHALRHTGRTRLSRQKADSARAGALDTMGRRLASARTPGEVGEILKGFLGDALPFTFFGFVPAPVEDLLMPRVYLRERSSRHRFDAVVEQLSAVSRDVFEMLPGGPVSPVVYGDLSDDDAGANAAPLQSLRWTLRSADGEAVGLVMLFRAEAFDVPAPVASVCDDLMSNAGMWLAGLVADRQNQIRLLQAIGEAIGEGMVWMEARRHYTVVNRAARRLLGLPEGTSIPRDRLLQRLREVGLYEDFFGDTARSSEVILKATSLPGSDQHHRVELLRVRTPAGMVRGAVILFRSLGNDGRDGSQLMEFSHDLRTPLNAIVGYAEVLRTGGDGAINEQQAAHLKCIVDAAQTIDGLVEYANANREAGRDPVKRPVETRALFESVVRDFEPDARQRNIRIEQVTGESGANHLYVDQTQIRLALSNLLSNAMRYTPDGGTIRLEARRAPSEGDTAASTMVPASALPENAKRPTTTRLKRGFIDLTVADNGPGVPVEDHERIFERFVQGKRGGRDGVHGLGLAITREIVRAHRGTITVESDPATAPGTTFRIRIPGGYDIDTDASA